MQVILHIGQQKTGSTAIQACLSRNRTQLAAQGVLYPRSLGEKKANLINDLVASGSGLGASREAILSSINAEFSGKYPRALISEENLFERADPHLVKEFFGRYATSWRILCYIRRPDEHINTYYQQGVKDVYICTFDRFFEKYSDSTYYRYADIIGRWAEAFGREAVEVRVFHRKTLEGSPIEDFTQWAGLDLEGLSFDAEERVNESLDCVNTELLRLLHLSLVEKPDLLQKHSLRGIVARLRSLDTGERLRLDTARAKRLQEKLQEDQKRLAERFLSPEHAAVLLAPPAEVPLPLPIDRNALAERIMTLFGDADLARFAAERAEQSTGQDRIPIELRDRAREEKVAAQRHVDQIPHEEVMHEPTHPLRRLWNVLRWG